MRDNSQFQRLAGELADTVESEQRIREALRDSEERLRLLLESTAEGMYGIDLAGRCTFINRAAAAMLGFSADDAFGRNTHALFHHRRADGSPYPADECPIFQCVHSGQGCRIATEVFWTRDGRSFPVEYASYPLIAADGAIRGAVVTFRDITERLQVEDALRESEARFRAVTQSAHDAIISADSAGKIIHWNQGAQTIFGYSAAEVLGKPLTILMPQRYREAHRQGLARAHQTGTVHLVGTTVEVNGLRKDGREFPMDLSLSVWDTRQGKFFSGIARDITVRKRAEEQLRLQNTHLIEFAESERRAHNALKSTQSQLVQTEKLASLGQLVAGVAHEINNPLAFVINNVAVLQRDVASLRDLLVLYQKAEPLLSQHLPELLAQIQELSSIIDLPYTLHHLEDLMLRSRDGLKRIQQIVKDLRDFARLDESDLLEVDLVSGIESTLHIIKSRAKKQDVALVTELMPLPLVMCYPAKINQVVLNLVANAIDACSAGGMVTVRTCTEKDGVAIHVIDTGSGIDPSIREKVFDPFFTTKPPGQGTGLGLSISYQIIHDHGGALQFESAPGQGTHFVIYLPLRPPLEKIPTGR